jgi:tetratricopeptide (TPR) repeat protein
MGRRYEALKIFERFLQFDEFAADANYNLGLFYWEDNNLDKSIAYFVKAIEKNPDHMDARNYLGVAFLKKGKIREGILQFEKALHIDPNDKNAQKNLQIALEMNKRNKNSGTNP